MIKNKWANKSVLITGVCGTVGLELLSQLKDKNCKYIVGIDNNESEVFLLSQKYKKYKKIIILLADINKKDRMIDLGRNIDIFLHTAALKNVDICEKSPIESIITNINGLNNMLESAEKNNAERFLFTSSDKAVNPTNVMGTTKLLGEKLVTAKNINPFKKSKTKFFSTRFGNVLGSAGSVVPIFESQIRNGGPLTVTDEKMTRFVMTIRESAEMVLSSVWMGNGGEVFVTKMPVMKIVDLAVSMIEILRDKKNIAIKKIGSKPGEKLYEELLTEEESIRSIQDKDFYIILPSYEKLNIKNKKLILQKFGKYVSSEENAMTIDQIKKYLAVNKLI